jgi:hypothetical protein
MISATMMSARHDRNARSGAEAALAPAGPRPRRRYTLAAMIAWIGGVVRAAGLLAASSAPAARARWAALMEAAWTMIGLPIPAHAIAEPPSETARPGPQVTSRYANDAQLRALLLRSQRGERAAYRRLLQDCAIRTACGARAGGLGACRTRQAVRHALLTTHRALRTFRSDQHVAAWQGDIVTHAIAQAAAGGAASARLLGVRYTT